MKKLSENVKTIIELGIKRLGSASELARASGTAPVNLSRWLSGERTPRVIDFSPVMQAAGVDLHIIGEELMEYGIIPKTSAKAGAGSSLETDDADEGYYAFRKDWLNKLGISEKNAVLMDVVGDSMEPILKAGDTLLVDKNDTFLMEGKIYVVSLQDELLVKRVQKDLDVIILHSENPRYSDICIAKQFLNQLHVRGRVRWVGKEL